jgi:peptidylprolyl isomerase
VRRFLLPFLLAAVLATGVLASAPVAVAATADLTSVTVTGTVGEKPTVAVAKPVAVKQTKSQTVTKGTGAKAVKGSTVTLDYVFVNGRTGAELETSYGAASVSLPMDRTKTRPAIVDSLIGERVGSRVVVAIAPKDGMTKAMKSDAIKLSDTLLFVADIKAASAPLDRAAGAAVAPVDGLPTVKLAKNGAPTITIPKNVDPPTTLVAQPLITGTGPVVQAGQTVTVHYTGIVWDTGTTFDSSWKTGSPVDFSIGTGAVIAGWDEGLVGQPVGSQMLLVIPPDKGYGADGQSGAGIKGTDTLVFVVDILSAT